MNANQAYEEIELAAYELAESERMERAAKAKRLKAIKKLARLSIYFKEGIDRIQREPKKEYSNDQDHGSPRTMATQQNKH